MPDQDSHLRAGAVSGATMSLPQSTRLPILDASSTELAEPQGSLAPESRDTKLLRTIVRSSAIILCVSITADIFNTTLFALHPIFITLGFLGLMSEGIQQSHSFRALEGQDRLKAVWRHAIVQTAACVCVAVGFGAIYVNKIRLGKLHFQSYHGFIGVLTTAAVFVVMLGGCVAFRRLGLLQKLPLSVQPAVKRAHTIAGALVWAAALFNVLLGLRTHGAGPRTMVHYGQGIVVLLMAVAQGALLLQPRPALRAEQQDAAKIRSEMALLSDEDFST
eukprot:jgi/Ulvmu1/2709/UM014_0165.1